MVVEDDDQVTCTYSVKYSLATQQIVELQFASKSEMQVDLIFLSHLVQEAGKMKINLLFTESHEGRHHHKQEQTNQWPESKKEGSVQIERIKRDN